MTSYIFYCLRHKPTGKLMPELRKGYTGWEPSENWNSQTGLSPRLFTSESAAKLARTAWLKGYAIVRSGSGQEFNFDIPDIYASSIEYIEPDSGPRNPNDIEVLRACLEIPA